MFSAIFPGQGSQAVGMGQLFFDNFDSSKKLFEEASDVLSIDFKKLCFEGPEEELTLTENTQPALLLVSTCMQTALREKMDISFTATAGHSIGEYAAVVAAGSMQFSDAMKAVRERGLAMQSAVPVGEGGMLACIGLDEEQVDFLCSWAMKESGLGPIEPANYNSPGQIVISGSKKLVDWIAENAKEDIFENPPKRMMFIPLKVSAPFHCSMMKPAEEKMRALLGEMNFSDASFPIVQNFSAEAVTDADTLRENLIRQVSAPVKWVQCVNKLKELGVQNCVELGHGKVLAGLLKKIDRSGLKTFNIQSLEDFNAIEELL